MVASFNTAIDLQLKSVLIATDFSATSEKAIRHALAIARHFRAKLYLLHVVSSLGIIIAGPDAIAQSTTLAFRDLTLLERELVTSGALREMRHQAMVCSGDIWTELQRVIGREDIDLVVLGTHGRSGFKKLVLGSVAEQVFRHAGCPVLTVGPCSPPDAPIASNGAPRPVLFPTDFSDASLQALPYAVSIAGERRTNLVLLHMLSLAPHGEGHRRYTAADVEQIQMEARATARRQLRGLAAQANFAIEPALVAEFGPPAEGILRVASELHAEAIVIGLHRRVYAEVSAHLPWSTAYEVACQAACPVLTVRADAGLTV